MLTRATTSTTTAKSSSQRNHPYGRKGGQKSTRVTSRVTSSSGRKRNKLHVNYTTPSLPGSFTAVRNLKRYTKGETFNAVKRYLAAQDAYTLHKQRRIRFPRRKTYSKGIADLYQADLVDMTNISRYSDSHRFLSTTIDCFRKMNWVTPLLTKSADRVTDAFERVLASAPKCAMLQTDRGKSS